MKQLTFLMIFLAINVIANCQLSVLEYIPSSNNSNKKFEKFEVEIKLSQSTFINPYDESEIDVEVEFVNSGIPHKVEAFWYQPFSRCSNCPDPTIIPNNNCSKNPDAADPNYLTPQSTTRPWRARFAPPSSGWWKYRVKVTYNNSTFFTSYKWKLISNSTNKGFVEVADNNQNFRFGNGDIFFPIGMNVVIFGNELIYNRLPYVKLKDAIQKISNNGGNLIRLWLGANTFEFEWGTNNIGNYDNRQNRMFDFDELLEIAEDNNVYFQLTINEAYEFSDLWENNPYSTLIDNGEDQDEFFTKQSCKDLHKQKLRYIISRWGYSPNIMAFEMWNEVDFYKDNGGFWGNKANVENWHIDMINHAKGLDMNRHMFTTNTGFFSAGDVLYGLSQVDFVPDHHYSIDYNSEFQYNYLSKFSLNNFDKPYILAEYGDHHPNCWLGASNFTSNGYSVGNYFHDVDYMHQTIWSSSFSGAGGSGLFWWANHVFNDCWGGQYKYFKPFSKYIEGVNLLSKPYISISNSCNCSGIKDEPHPSWCNSPPSQNNCHPLCKTGENSANSVNTNYTITTSNDCKIEVFAMVDEDKVVGWIHNKDNYWYNLPHNAGPSSESECSQLNDNQPSSPIDIATLINETITISNLPCDGVYKIEFFSTYPEYDINNDGINEDGGVIPSFTLNNIGVHCGDLTFTIPKLQALGTAPYAPDYGFKVSKEQNSWTNILPSTSSSYKINGDISGDNNNIFYKGTDNRLHHYWYGNGQWNHEWLTNWSNSSQNVGGDIAYHDGDVFYKGTDSRLHHYWYGNGQWNHEWLTNWSNSSQNVGGDIAYHDGDVFYKGTDGRLHHYWYGNGQWNHEWLTDWSNSSYNVGGDIAYHDGDVFYKGTDSRLHHYWYGNGQWNHEWLTNWSNSSQNVGYSISIPQVDGKVFYEGTDDRLHEYYFSNGQWNHTWHTDWANTSQNIGGEIACSPDGTHVFYRGNDGYIHQQYYMGNGQWGHDWMICYDYLNSSLKGKSHISSSNNKVFYEGNDSKVHIWEYGNECNPQPFLMISNNEDEHFSTIDLKQNTSISSSSIMEFEAVSYPNPFSNQLYIKGINPNQSINVVDVMGRIYYESPSSNTSELGINTALWPGGVYIVIVRGENETNNNTIKIIKE